MNAILMVLRTGMRWNALDATAICSSKTAHRRAQEWRAAGVFCEDENHLALLQLASGRIAFKKDAATPAPAY